MYIYVIYIYMYIYVICIYYIYIYIYIYVHTIRYTTIKLFPSLIKCSVSYTIEQLFSIYIQLWKLKISMEISIRLYCLQSSVILSNVSKKQK